MKSPTRSDKLMWGFLFLHERIFPHIYRLCRGRGIPHKELVGWITSGLFSRWEMKEEDALCAKPHHILPTSTNLLLYFYGTQLIYLFSKGSIVPHYRGKMDHLPRGGGKSESTWGEVNYSTESLLKITLTIGQFYFHNKKNRYCLCRLHYACS
jgi:hypothetical protein